MFTPKSRETTGQIPTEVFTPHNIVQPAASPPPDAKVSGSGQQKAIIRLPFGIRIIPLAIVVAYFVWDVIADISSGDQWSILNIIAFGILLLPLAALSLLFLLRSFHKTTLIWLTLAIIVVGLLSTPHGISYIIDTVISIAKTNQVAQDQRSVAKLGYDVYLPTVNNTDMSPGSPNPKIYTIPDVGTVLSMGADDILIANAESVKKAYGDCPPARLLRRSVDETTCKFFATTPNGTRVYLATDPNLMDYYYAQRGNTLILFLTILFDDINYKDPATAKITAYVDGFQKAELKDTTFLVKETPVKLAD